MSRDAMRNFVVSFFLPIFLITVTDNAFAANKTANKTLKIAITAPFTGAYSGYGSQILAGAQQAASDINRRGGIKGIKLEVVPIDDQCDPGIAVNQAKKIVADKNFQAVIGHACSAACLAGLAVYDQHDILVVSPTATNTQLTNIKRGNFFRMSGVDDLQAQTATSFLVNKLQSKKIAIMHDGDMYSKDLADMLSELLAQLEIAPSMYMEVERGIKKFDSMIKLIKEREIDAIYFPGLYPEVGALAKELHREQLQIPIMTGDGAVLKKFVNIVGNNKTAGSVLMTFVADPHLLESTQATITTMQAKHQETFGYTLYAYAALEVIAQAIENNDTTAGKTLANWLHQNQVPTILGNKSWDTNGNIIDSHFQVYLWNTTTNQLKPIVG